MTTYRCPLKYTSYHSEIDKLTCKPSEIARIWEDNVDMLVEDQREDYGCLNMDCCSQLDILITGRFSVVTVSCMVIAMYLGYFIINQQYMIKVTSRYNAAFLNHNGDFLNLAT